MSGLREKLRIKPIVEEEQKINIVVPVPTKPVPVLLATTIIDEQGAKEFGANDLAELARRMENARMKRVTKNKMVSPINEELVGEKEEMGQKEEKKEEVVEKIKTAIVKKLPRKKLVLLEEEGESISEDISRKVVKKRTKLTKGISILPPEEWVNVDSETNIITRLPVKEAKVQYKVASYYMNNREIFINAVNALFEPYRSQVLDDTSQITCDNIGNEAKKFSLLIHQLVVRDYMNLYTPYRGLLLYFGLGAGKTCTSIALAEGMKGSKKIIVMTPASLRANYISELKKCGDALYKTNQYWEWIDIIEHPETVDTLSSILNLSVDYITRHGGAWLVNVRKPEPYPILSPAEKTSLDDQINEMIESKYKFINYNGLRRTKWAEMTNNYETNVFDNAVVIIDEAHNLISRIVNKIGKEKAPPIDPKTGKIERRPYSLAMNLYQDLMGAQNARIVLLTGTPIINYPNEVGILFNILRGYIKQWEYTLDIKTSKPVNEDVLKEIFLRENSMDYLEYSSSTKKLKITRNPFGFENNIKRTKDVNEKYHGVSVSETIISDESFERNVIRILRNNEIDLIGAPVIYPYTALPDKLEDFTNMFIDSGSGELKNEMMLKKRIMGLASYYKSAQESLLPQYDKLTDYHVLKIPMSDYQFTIYEDARKAERKLEKDSKKKKGKVDENGVYKDPSSTYRIFSRLFCNFVMPKPPGRPLPIEKVVAEVGEGGGGGRSGSEVNGLDEMYAMAQKESEKIAEGADGVEGINAVEDENDLEGDQIIDKIGDSTYIRRMQTAIQYVEEHAAEYLSPEGLVIYSPKYLQMLENIQNPEHVGLHLVYSQFRTLEGIGMFTLILDQNGFTRFKIKKDISGQWELDISEENRGKPTYALYTGTESKEEKEMMRNIYNGDWTSLTPAFSGELREIAYNNNMGDIIKVFMITASGSEGINLRNTRYVHIMEPYWHPARIDQVVGRARRICSHKELPESLQTVEVFVYLMTFTPEQVKSDVSIELKQKDLSKRKYKIRVDSDKMEYIPLTSDEALFEISNIKEELSSKLTKAIKESSIDCALYSRAGAKEQLHCLQFGNPSPNAFSYKPDYKKDTEDRGAALNKEKISWRGKEVTLRGITYMSRKMPELKEIYLYDLDSYKRALETAGVDPVLVATIKTNERGEQVVHRL